MQGVSLGTMVPAGAVAWKVAVQCRVKQIMHAGRVIERKRNAALIGSGRPCAAIVGRQAEAIAAARDPFDEEIALSWLCTWDDLNIGLCAGDPLEIFQALFDCTQVQDVAGTRRDRAGIASARRGVGKANFPDSSWNKPEEKASSL